MHTSCAGANVGMCISCPASDPFVMSAELADMQIRLLAAKMAVSAECACAVVMGTVGHELAG